MVCYLPAFPSGTRGIFYFPLFFMSKEQAVEQYIDAQPLGEAASTVETADAPRATHWKRIGGYTGAIAVLSLASVLGVRTALQSKAGIPTAGPKPHVPHLKDAHTETKSSAEDEAMKRRKNMTQAKEAWECAARTNLPEEIQRRITEMDTRLSEVGATRADIQVTEGMVASVSLKLAERFWMRVQTPFTNQGMQDALKEMDVALARTQCTREDIGATREAVSKCYLDLAKQEWERANYFSDIHVFVFQFDALREMQRALDNAGATLGDIGVSAAQVEELRSRAKAASRPAANE